MSGMNAITSKMMAMRKGIVDTGAKTMLKTDIAFLEREVKVRKQTFGVEMYDCMAALEADDGESLEDKEKKVRECFDAARRDIAVIQAKVDCKKEEMSTINSDASAAAVGGVQIPADYKPAETAVIVEE